MEPAVEFFRAAVRFGLAAAACGAVACASAQPADYPSQPVRMVVGFPAGGSTDVAARFIADELGKSFGQPVVVDNRPGANATIAADFVARARPDGYTLLMSATNHSINAVLYRNLKFDSERDFTPIAAVAETPIVLVVNPKFPARDYREFAALVAAHPGRYSYASAGNGGSPHLAGETYKMLTRTAIVHIPYKGAGPALNDLMGGQVDMYFATLGSVLPQIKAGQVRALAVAYPTRSPLLPGTPTFEESGLKNFRLDSWFGLLAPAHLPPAVLDRLSREITRIAALPAFRERMEGAGFTPVTDSSPPKLAAQIHQEIVTFRKVVDANGITID